MADAQSVTADHASAIHDASAIGAAIAANTSPMYFPSSNASNTIC
jgi:hypothetical protein